MFLLASINSIGQKIKRPGANAGPEVTKGYYSIGDHYKKLNPGIQLSTDSVITPLSSKGYHSIGAKDRKLNKRPYLRFRQAPRPVITKGYYSIGNNNEKQ